MAFAPPIGEPPAVQFIPIGKLKVDDAYQRTIEGRASQKLIESIAKRWDWRLCVPLLVAARGSDLFIIDGQHRWAAAELRGDITFLPCAVGNYESAAEEAALFVAANRRRVAVNRLDLFRAALAGEDEASMTIHRLLSQAGLSMAEHTVRRHLRRGQISTTAILYRALSDKGEERLAATLAMAGSAFGDQVITYSGVIISALQLLNIEGLEEAQRARLLNVLRRRSADEWATIPEVVRAKGGGQRANQLYFTIRDELRRAPPSAASNEDLAPIRPAAKLPEVSLAPAPPLDGRTWCDQCERRVSASVAERCNDRFCKAKGAIAA